MKDVLCGVIWVEWMWRNLFLKSKNILANVTCECGAFEEMAAGKITGKNPNQTKHPNLKVLQLCYEVLRWCEENIKSW